MPRSIQASRLNKAPETPSHTYTTCLDVKLLSWELNSTSIAPKTAMLVESAPVTDISQGLRCSSAKPSDLMNCFPAKQIEAPVSARQGPVAGVTDTLGTLILSVR